MIAPAGHHCDVRSGHLNATFGGKDMGSMAQTGLLLVPSDALGHTWALPGVVGAGQGLPPPPTGPKNLNARNPGEVLPRLSGFLSGRVNLLGRASARLRQLFPQQAGSTSPGRSTVKRASARTRETYNGFTPFPFEVGYHPTI